MPTYTYACEKHGTFDVTKPMSDADKVERCPECGSPASRVWSANIDNTMYKRDPSSKDYWKNNMSTSEQAKVYTGEREPY